MSLAHFWLRVGERFDVQQGFSLVECLLVLAIMGVIIGSMAITSLSVNRVNYQSHQMLAILRFARNFSVFHHRPVQICASSDGSTCDGQWQNGLIVSDYTRKKVLYVKHWRQYACRMNKVGRGWRNGKIIFNSLGFASGSQGRFQFFGRHCHSLLNIVLSPCGRARIRGV